MEQEDLLYNILLNADIDSVSNMCKVSQTTRNICNNYTFWDNYYNKNNIPMLHKYNSIQDWIKAVKINYQTNKIINNLETIYVIPTVYYTKQFKRDQNMIDVLGNNYYIVIGKLDNQYSIIYFGTDHIIKNIDKNELYTFIYDLLFNDAKFIYESHIKDYDLDYDGDEYII
jgi:hypothetical protein